MATMTHPPQEVLIKVMCSERLPEESGMYRTNLRDCAFFRDDMEFQNDYGHKLPVEYWYEPATRIVLTVEELQDLLSDARSEGYNNASMDAGSRY